MPKPPRRLGALNLPAPTAQALMVVDDVPVSLTHLDKVYFPGEGITKRDLLDYGRDVSEFLLPYLRDRPYTMKRYVNGAQAGAFFQKDAHGKVPSWILTSAQPSGRPAGEIHYVLCNDLPTLLYLVNLGCIDHNVWMSRAETPLAPDFVLLDLDPGPRAPFSAAVRVAIELRRLCDDLEILALPKTSGATGLHIWIPIAPGHTFEQSQQFAALLLRLAAQRVPELVTEVWPVAKRPADRVYLDFRQNAHGKTIPPPYSPRPHPGATVSCPLEWREVRPALDPRAFTIKTMGKRLDRVGDLFSPLLREPKPRLAEILRRIAAG